MKNCAIAFFYYRAKSLAAEGIQYSSGIAAYILAKRESSNELVFGNVVHGVLAAAATAVSIPAVVFAPPTAVVIPAAVGSLYAAVIMRESIVDAKQIKNLTKQLLVDNDIDMSAALKKIKLSKMTLQNEYMGRPTPLRNKVLKMGELPINTKKTRDHLNAVFPDKKDEINNILSNTDNYDYCPNTKNTENGYLSEHGWREILKLCIS